MKVGDWINGLKYPLSDYAQILVKEESINHIIYTVECFRTEDKYKTIAKIGYDKKSKKWKAAYGSIVGGSFWGDMKEAPKLITPIDEFNCPDFDLFINEEPERD